MMILAIDVGNTTTEFGVFEQGKPLQRWRAVTRNRMGDELTLLVRGNCNSRGIALEAEGDCVMCSVVPPLTSGFVEMAVAFFGREPLVVDGSTDAGLRILYRDPLSVGGDRIATAVGAVERFGKPVVVVDMGTATTIDVVSGAGDYLGGAIAPGVGTAAEELFRRAARLPRVELKQPPSAIGKSTEESLQSGIVYGAAGQIEGLLARVLSELDFECPVVATGGHARLIARHCSRIDHVEDGLVLEGLRAIHARNSKSRGS
ncbi:MAG: type III pantothenate kinase [Candidatus Eiseniibacteriota bacterium]|nr:MAG: type III pantothenate kinase [Candidatus Eisenbacteria bacterium]